LNPRKLSPRKILEAISEGHLKPQYIGKHSYDSLKQMISSLFNEFKPDVMTHREIRDWLQKLIGIYDAIKKDIGEPQPILLKEIHERLLPYVESIDSNKDRALVGAICEMTQTALNDLDEDVEDEEKPCECTENKIKEPTKINDDGLVHKDGSGNDGLIRHP